MSKEPSATRKMLGEFAPKLVELTLELCSGEV